MASLSGRQDSAAGDLIPGISSRLGAEIIRHGMDDHRAADQISGMETFIIEGTPGIALISQKGDQITGVAGMELHSGIIMFSSPGKIMGAVAGLMDVHGIIIGRAGHVGIGKAKDFRFNQCSAVGRVIEFYQAADLGSLTASADPGCGLGVVLL